MAKRSFQVVVGVDGMGPFAWCPGFDDCHVRADTKIEALEGVRVAIQAQLQQGVKQRKWWIEVVRL